MRVLQNTIQKNVLILGVILSSLLLVSGIVAENRYYGMVLLGIVFIVLFMVKFEITFPLLLIARSSLDIFTDIGFDIGPLNFNIPAGISIFIDAMGLIYLGLVFYREKKFPTDNISRIFFVWLLSLLFWVFWAYHNFGEEGLSGVREWTRLFSLLIIYLLSMQIAKFKGYEYLVNCTLLSLVIPVTIGYYQIFTDSPLLVSHIGRIYGTLAHPNVFSIYLLLFMAVTVWKLKFAKVKFPWIVLLIILLFALVNTFSVTGIVMFVIFIFILIYKEFELKYRITFFLLSLIFLFVFINTEVGQKRINELKTTPSFTVVSKDEVVTNSFTWRIVNWKLLYGKWVEQPLLGFGLSTSGLVNPWYLAAPHNDYLRFLVELGLVGFSICMWFMIRIGFYIRDRYRSCMNDKQKYLTLLMGTVFICWMAGAIVDNCIIYTTFQFYFWAILAGSMTGKSNKEHEGVDIHNLSR